MKKILSKFVQLVKLVKRCETEIILAGIVSLISFLSFQAGKIHTLNRQPDRLDFNETSEAAVFLTSTTSPQAVLTNPTTVPDVGLKLPVVVSRHSNKYHFLWCSGAKKISLKNKVTFSSEKEALAAGYLLASNCQK